MRAASLRPVEKHWLAIAVFLLAFVPRAIIYWTRLSGGPSGFPGNPFLSSWADYTTFYVPVMKMIAGGLLPYYNFAYSYPPVFAYFLTPFYMLGGQELPAAALVALDSLSALLVYLCAGRLASQRAAFLSAAVYALSPAVLFEADFLWLSVQPMLFFILLSTFLMLRGRVASSAVAIAVAIGCKQEAIFAFPAILVWAFARRRQGRDVWRAGTITLSVLVVCSIPFLLVAPASYLFSISYGLLGSPPSYWASLHNTTAIASISSVTSQGYLCNATTVSNVLGSFVNCGGPAPYSFVIWQMVAFYLDRIALVIVPLILLWILILLLYLQRSSERTWILLGAASMSAGLAVFSYLVHPILLYYLVPVYGLILASGIRRSWWIVSVAQLLTVTLPDGNLQQLLPTAAVLLILILGLRDGGMRNRKPLLEASAPEP